MRHAQVVGSSVLPTELLSSLAGGPKQPEGPPPEDVQRRAAKRRREHDDTDEGMAWSDKVPAPSGWLEKAAALANAVELGHWRDVHNWVEEFKYNDQFERAIRRAKVNRWKPRWG